MNISFFEIEEWEEPFIKKNLTDHQITFDTQPLILDKLEDIKNTEILSVFIYSLVTKEMLEKLPNLKYIVTRSTGVDHIDLKACRDKGIVVSNIPVYGTNTVAEHTFALILALSRKIVPSVERTRRGDFSIENLRGFDLFRKTIGIIGAGNIGKSVVKIAKGFEMDVIAYTKHEEDAIKCGATYVELDELLKRSDVVSLHLPYTKETHHIINKENITKFKKGSILINTARGGLIETEAILLGLEKGYLSGVGVDVLEEEIILKEERQLLTEQFTKQSDFKTQLLNHVLLDREDVIITPHNAFNSTESLNHITEISVENIQSYVAGKTINLVDSV